MDSIRDRIVELRRVPADELIANEKNWRIHPTRQRKAMAAALESIGMADALLVREDADGVLHLIDGHMRAEMTAGENVPVLVLDVDENEADQLGLSFDPLGDMAEMDDDKFEELREALGAFADTMDQASNSFDAAEADMPELASGDREPFQQMTFTLSDEQAEQVKHAMAEAKGIGPFIDTGNENSNGNALARIAEAYGGTS